MSLLTKFSLYRAIDLVRLAKLLQSFLLITTKSLNKIQKLTTWEIKIIFFYDESKHKNQVVEERKIWSN